MSTRLLLPEVKVELGSGDSDLVQELLRADLKRAAKANKAARKAKVLQQIREQPSRLPDGTYSVIVADPPWQYDTKVEEGAGVRGLVSYPTMSLEQILQMPVSGLAADTSVLWLWTTNSFLDEAFDVMRRWGFWYRTLLTWDKVAHGVGFYLQNVTEHCLLGVRGSPLFDIQGAWRAHKEGRGPAPVSRLESPRAEHSRKPEAFYQLVENLCPAPSGGRVELFARAKREGWVAWGAETDQFEVAR